jgi:hypothetical protein
VTISHRVASNLDSTPRWSKDIRVAGSVSTFEVGIEVVVLTFFAIEQRNGEMDLELGGLEVRPEACSRGDPNLGPSEINPQRKDRNDRSVGV